MSDVEQPTTESALSFEHAEFENQAPAALACAFCRQPITGQYWQISKRPACEHCRAKIQSELDSSGSSQRFLHALGFGALAATAGSVGWMLITKLTGYEIGFVAIGVGYLVGKAVRKGAGGFGGVRYQVLAMVLTYSAIALASLPTLLGMAPDGSQVSWPTLLSIALASPFLSGTHNIMGLFIIGIGLYEAWKLTRAMPVNVLGPFSIETVVKAPLALGTNAAD